VEQEVTIWTTPNYPTCHVSSVYCVAHYRHMTEISVFGLGALFSQIQMYRLDHYSEPKQTQSEYLVQPCFAYLPVGMLTNNNC